MVGYIKKDDFYFGDKLTPTTKKRLSSKAMLGDENWNVGIQYVHTVVFNFDKEKQIIKLNTNGRTTKTSKKWINYWFDYLNLNLEIRVEDYEWFVCSNWLKQYNIEMAYYDNFIIDLKKWLLKNWNKKYKFKK